jgi:hypothetical protein
MSYLSSLSPRLNALRSYKDSALARASWARVGGRLFYSPLQVGELQRQSPLLLLLCFDQPHYHSPCIFLRLVCRRAVVEVKKKLRRDI